MTPTTENWKESVEEMARKLWRNFEYESEIEAEEALVKFVTSLLSSQKSEIIRNFEKEVDAGGLPAGALYVASLKNQDKGS